MPKRVGANKRKQLQKVKPIKKKHVRRLLSRLFIAGGIGCALVATGFGCLFGFKKVRTTFDQSKLLTIDKVIVKKNEFVQEKEILERAGIEVSSKLYKLKVDSVVKKIKTNPWIEKVRIKRRLWGTVIISIREREPVALVQLGEIVQMDKHDVLLPIQLGAPSKLPLLYGLRDTTGSGIRRIKKKDFERFMRFKDDVERNDKSLFQHFSQIDLSETGCVRLMLQGYPTVIELGEKQVALRLDRLKQLKEMLHDFAFAPAKINLRFENLAFVTEAKSNPDYPD
jgi:cell division protein FtsQ